MQTQCQKESTPIGIGSVGVAARKYYVVSTMLTTLIHYCKPDANKKTEPVRLRYPRYSTYVSGGKVWIKVCNSHFQQTKTDE